MTTKPTDDLTLSIRSQDDISSLASSSSDYTSESYRSSHSRALARSYGSTRRSARGRPSYLFSISKRPRRNVKKRSILNTPPPLEAIGEDNEMFMGTMTNDAFNRREIPDRSRVPKAALALFLLICSIGSYRSINDSWISHKAEALVKKRASPRIELAENSLRGLVGVGQQGTALGETFPTSKSISKINTTSSGNQISRIGTILEETPMMYFDKRIFVPEQLSNLANIFYEPFNPWNNKLLFWHIPRSGATTIKQIASRCMGLTLASEAGKSELGRGGVALGSPGDFLKIVESLDGTRFANVDMSNPDGIARAKALHIERSDRIDLISSPYLYDAASLFDSGKKGFMIALFRHPIDRAVSLYYNMRQNYQYQRLVGNLDTVEQYSKSSLVENNWMTRFLSNTLSGELTLEQEAIAKEVLRTKCLVGILREKAETMRRFEVFFNARADRSQRRMECQEKMLYWDWPGKNRHEPVLEGSVAWNNLRDQNTFDIRLYEYAEQLFEAQAKLFSPLQNENPPSTW